MRFGTALVLASFSSVIMRSLGGCSADGLDSDLPPEVDASDSDAALDAAVEARARDASPDRTSVDAGTHDATTGRDAAPDARDATALDGANDASRVDASDASEAAAPVVDAGWDPTGATCASANATQARQCGRCGIEKRLCWSPDGGTPTWLPWGPCLGEKEDGGLPNTVVVVPCEKCGTKEIRYDSMCMTSVGFCAPAPGAQCEKHAVEFASGLSCTSGLGRYRECNDECTWEGYGTCTAYVNPNAMTVAPLPAADGGAAIVSAQFSFSVSPKGRRLISFSNVACPITDTAYPESTETGFAYVEVKNPTARTVTVDLWHGTGDTQMAAYAGSAIPEDRDDATRRACLAGTSANDTCPTALADKCAQPAQYSTAGIAAVKIPPNGSITVWNALKYAPASASPFTLNVRTTAVE